MIFNVIVTSSELECTCGDLLEHVELIGNGPTGVPLEYYECPGCGEFWDMDLEPIDLEVMEAL